MTGLDRRTSILGDLEFSIPGFLRFGKFGKYFSFLVGWIREGFFFRGGRGRGRWGIQINLKIRGCARVVVLLPCILGAS